MTQASLLETDFPPVAPYLSETQQSVYDWTVEVFGKVASPVATLIRAQEELVELLTAIVNEHSDGNIAEEAADVMILLYRYAGAQGIKLTWDTEWVSDSVMVSAAAANSILARLIAGSTQLAAPGSTRPAITKQQSESDLHWVASHMARVCNFLHRDIYAEIERKMQVNRLRQWSVNKSGNGYHIGEDAAEALVFMRERGPFGNLAA